jgi:enolase
VVVPISVVDVSAIEVLDSRGRPTLSVSLQFNEGFAVRASVPSGASTGSHEAVELRDGDPKRFGGQGVVRAVTNVNGEIAAALRGRQWTDLASLDTMLVELDGTTNKSRLGANALLGVSMAAARAFACSKEQSLWQTLGTATAPRLPIPHFNVINGGMHAPNDLEFQEFMIAPLGAPTLTEAIRAGAEVYESLRLLLAKRGEVTSLGDEGGFAPQIAHPEDVLELLVEAISAAGYRPSIENVAIALDPAASSFYRTNHYEIGGERLSSVELISRYEQIINDFPVRSIEDGLAEDDLDGWVRMTDRLGSRVQLVGDDILVTNPARIAAAIEKGIGNAALIKPNQIGTVTETLAAMTLCRDAGWGQMVSHRSGETDDTFIADLAVASGCGQLKSGAPARGERVAKYNRLMEIAAYEDLDFGLVPS